MAKKDYVTTGTCAILNNAMDAKIGAQEKLFKAEIQGFKNTVYGSVTTLGIVLSVLTLALKFWRP